jgi:hypothetical protein
MPEVLAFDPGGATGWSLWFYDVDEPMQRVDYGVVAGGADGFCEWLWRHHSLLMRASVHIIEHYVPDGGPGEVDDALQVEGALRGTLAALCLPPLVQQRRHDKRQVSDDLLHRVGLWVGNDEVDWEDARDVNDSEIHALAWAKMREHLPTLAAYWPDAA